MRISEVSCKDLLTQVYYETEMKESREREQRERERAERKRERKREVGASQINIFHAHTEIDILRVRTAWGEIKKRVVEQY